MADITQLHPGKASPDTQRKENRREEFERLDSERADLRRGFSARLNLLCSLAEERELGSGRLEDIQALNPDWSTELVEGWITRDRPPRTQDLRLLVQFLVRNLPAQTDAEHWEAFLLYGSERIRNPLRDLTGDGNRALMRLASISLAQVLSEHQIAADSYDAEAKLRETVEFLRKLNVDSNSQQLAAGHQLMLAAALFPDAVTSQGF